MLKGNFLEAKEAVKLIQDGMTVCPVGMTLVSASETVLKAIESILSGNVTSGEPYTITFVRAERPQGWDPASCPRGAGNQNYWLPLGPPAQMDGDDCE